MSFAIAVVVLSLSTLNAPSSTSLNLVAKPVFVVATTAEVGDSWYAVAEQSSKAHAKADIVRFDPGSLEALVVELRKRRARYVQFVVPPSVIDVNFCFELLEAATTVDSDPFVDFAYGFITGRSPEAAQSFLKRCLLLVKSKKGVPRTILDNLGPNTQVGGTRMIPWGGPKWTAFAKGFASELFTHGNEGMRPEDARVHEGRGLIHFGGHGEPSGITDGLSAKMVKGLNLKRSVVFNGACSTGVTSRYFKRGASGVEIEQFEDDDLFCLNLIDTGVAAYFAAVHPDHGIPVYQEMEFMLTTGADCGDTMKHSYDSVVMGNGGKALRCPRLEVGKPDPIDTPKAVMLYGTAARILFGDPAARPVVKPIPGPYKIKVQKKGKGFRAQVRLVNPAVKYSLQDTFHFHLSADKSQFNDRVYVRVPLPKKLADVSELSVSRAFAGSTNLEHELLCYAVEEWHGQRFLHVQIDFPTTGYQMSKMRTSDTTVWIDFR